jgi:RHS repeat-associated protein
MLLPNRHESTSEYRYSYMGQEHDDEIKGEGNSINFKYRMYDSRINRFFAVDPLAPKYPELTPYQCASNSPIYMIELEGLEGINIITREQADGSTLTDVTYATNQLGMGNEGVNRTFIDKDGNITSHFTALVEVVVPDMTAQVGSITPANTTPENNDPSFFENLGNWDGGYGPIVAIERAFGGDGFSTMRYDYSMYGEAGFYGNGGQLALGTVFFIITMGQSSSFLASGKSLLSWEGAWVTFDVAQSVDGLVGYSDYFPESLKTVWDVAGLLSAKGGLLKTAQAKMIGESIVFIDKAGAVVAIYEVVDGVYTLPNK